MILDVSVWIGDKRDAPGYDRIMAEMTSEHSDNRNALLALLTWYRGAGVDAVVADVATDWLARGDVPLQRVQAPSHAATQSGAQTAVVPGGEARPGERQPMPGARPTVPPADVAGKAQRQFVPTSPDAAVADAQQAAGQATTLAALQAALSGFDGCGLKATAKNLCFYRGAEQARVMVIGEAPGRDEDRSGMPFVGRAGQLLDKMLAAIALDEAEVHITNVVYWRPPGNRTPTPHEVLVCRPFLERQIELVAPDIVLTVGGPAAKAILDTTQGIMRTRGKWGQFEIAGGSSVTVMPTLHPAYLLRTPAAKRLAWRDLLAVRARLDGEH